MENMNLFSQNQGKAITVRFVSVILLCLSLISILFVASKKTTTDDQQIIIKRQSLELKEGNLLLLLDNLESFEVEIDDLDDFDNDGLSNELERIYETDPFLNDTDFDGILDGDEVFLYQTIPNDSDSDSDYLCDSIELFKYRTNPMKKDTDGDKIDDGIEICVLRSNPLVIDSDYDLLNDYEEKYIYNTNINNDDTDLDGLNDGMEIFVYKTNPNSLDTDDDSKSDRWEIENNRNPTVADNWYNIVGYVLVPGIPFTAIIIGIFASADTKLVSSLSLRTQELFSHESPERLLLNLLNYIPENNQINVEELAQLTGESVDVIQKLLSEIFGNTDKWSEFNMDNVVIKSQNETVQFNYDCFYCGGIIDFIADICSICLEPIVRCKVCNNPISFNSNYATCASCGIIGKTDDVLGILKIELICETCLMTTKYNYI